MTVEEQIERLTGIVNTLAGAVVAHDRSIEAHDRQIDALIQFAEKQKETVAALERQWQAYINTLPRH